MTPLRKQQGRRLELSVTEFSQILDDEVHSCLMRANEELTRGLLVVVLTVDYVLSCILVKRDVELGSLRSVVYMRYDLVCSDAGIREGHEMLFYCKT